ncbi:MAG: hypothetical protein OJF62_002317 [Pseudolabrys sp.]|jgi:hypothetical protein|nr:hypothetical protein [Pseudolabrys sp.]
MPLLQSGDRKLLYLHVPKTGGSSIESMLRKLGQLTLIEDQASTFPCAAQHLHKDILASLFRDRNEFTSIFMTVRHPFSRLESEYRYRVSHYSRPSFLVPEFERWVTNAFENYENNPFVYGNHIRPQVEFEIFDPVIFKLEDGLEAVAHHVATVLNLRAVPMLEHMNTNSQPLQLKWNRKLEDRVRAFYRDDFIRFGYH